MTECCPNGQCERLPENRDIICEMNAQRAEIERLRAALQQIRDVCKDNAPASCNQAMALSFVRHVASEALHVPGVSPVPPRDVRDIVESLGDEQTED